MSPPVVADPDPAMLANAQINSWFTFSPAHLAMARRDDKGFITPRQSNYMSGPAHLNRQ